MNRRAFVVVLDACGAGELPDAADYGDAGTNTLGHLSEAAGGLDLPVLGRLGLGSILPLVGVPPADEPVLHGRLHPLGPGKDTITGHWELMGVITPEPLRTYPDGFPDEILDQLHRRHGPRHPAQQALQRRRGDRGVRRAAPATGNLIVYTSADSVLQIAAHVDEVPLAELYAACEAAREIMTGEHAVGRVIARPFRGEPGAFERTTGRRDLALEPPARSYLEELQADGVPVHSVGKVKQVFADVGVDKGHPGATNARGDRVDRGADGRARAAASCSRTSSRPTRSTATATTSRASTRRCKVIDAAVGGWLERLDPERDLLVLTADHGCDPTTPGSDHTREHAPLLARFAGHGGRRHDGPLSDVGASVLRWLTGRDAPELPGEPFVP